MTELTRFVERQRRRCGGLASGSAPLRLSERLRVAAWCDGGVVLDLRRGKYYQVNETTTRLLQAFERQSLHPEAAVDVASSLGLDRDRVREDAEALLRSPVAATWLRPATRSRQTHRRKAVAFPERQTELPRPASSARFRAPDQGCPRATAQVAFTASVNDRVCAASAVVLAQAMIRLLPLDLTVRLLGLLKSPARHAVSTAECERMGVLVSRSGATFFVGLNCFTASLAVALFAASRGAVVTWCMGVRRDPFEAHAWVEAGRVSEADVDWVEGGYKRLFAI